MRVKWALLFAIQHAIVLALGVLDATTAGASDGLQRNEWAALLTVEHRVAIAIGLFNVPATLYAKPSFPDRFTLIHAIRFPIRIRVGVRYAAAALTR